MLKYIRESLHILSITLLTLFFPNLLLAASTNYQDLINQKISQMTLDQKVGQLFIVGFPQKSINKDLEAFVSKYKPGSFLLFKRNISSVEQIKNLNSDIYKLSFKYTKLPPLIAIDQEGGAVSRLPIVPAPPNAFALGKTQSPLLAEEMGYQTGLFLREVGFNMNLAPVLDVVDPFSASFIGVRSFGGDPELVATMGNSYSRGLLRAHVIPTAKHFPGSGSMVQDPHQRIVLNNSSYAELTEKDLKPFKRYAEIGSNTALMLSHLIYPALDSNKEPASFSRKISTEILRGQINYDGLVMTDDLQMQGSRQVLRPEAAALKALQAGADIVMLTWSFADQGKAFEHVKEALSKGVISEKFINEKLQRILSVKAFANIYRRDRSTPNLLQNSSLSSAKYMDLESKILDENFRANFMASDKTAISQKSRQPSSVEKICFVSSSRTFMNSFSKNFEKSFKSKFIGANSEANDLALWIRKSGCTVTLASITGPKTAALFYQFPQSVKASTVLINLSHPRLTKKTDGFSKVIELYFNHSDAGKKIARHFEELLRDLNYHLVLN